MPFDHDIIIWMATNDLKVNRQPNHSTTLRRCRAISTTSATGRWCDAAIIIVPGIKMSTLMDSLFCVVLLRSSIFKWQKSGKASRDTILDEFTLAAKSIVRHLPMGQTSRSAPVMLPFPVIPTFTEPVFRGYNFLGPTDDVSNCAEIRQNGAGLVLILWELVRARGFPSNYTLSFSSTHPFPVKSSRNCDANNHRLWNSH